MAAVLLPREAKMVAMMNSGVELRWRQPLHQQEAVDTQLGTRIGSGCSRTARHTSG